MAGNLDESLLKRFFKDYPSQSLSTNAKFWNLPDLPTLPTIHVSGDVNLSINGQTKNFSEGAFVFKKADGSLDAMPTKSAWGGGITVDGRAAQGATIDYNYRKSGNMAHLQLDEQAGKLRLNMPEGHSGTIFNYPAPTAQELAAKAEAQGVIIQARSGDRVIEGFFAEGKGGVLPTEIQAYHNGIDLKGGEFLSIHREANGEVRSLFAYRPYTAKDIEQFTSFGRYSTPGNDVKDLKALDGKTLLAAENPRLNVENGKAIVPRGFSPISADLDSLREQYINENVRDLQMRQQMAKEFPGTFGSAAEMDANQIRESASKTFEQKASTAWGQRELLAKTDELLTRNNKWAVTFAEKAGVELPKSELTELKLTRAFVEPEANSIFSKVASYLGESRLGKSIFGSGKVALGIAGAVVATELAIKGVEYASTAKSDNSENKNASLKLPELSVQADGSIKPAGMRDDLYRQANVDGLLQKASSDHSEKNSEHSAEHTRA